MMPTVIKRPRLRGRLTFSGVLSDLDCGFAWLTIAASAWITAIDRAGVVTAESRDPRAVCLRNIGDALIVTLKAAPIFAAVRIVDVAKVSLYQVRIIWSDPGLVAGDVHVLPAFRARSARRARSSRLALEGSLG